MYTLFAYPNSYAMTAHAVLEETNAPYEVKWVQIFTSDLDPEFKKVSPHGRVPALRHGNTTIFETGAIAHYIAERHPEVDLIIREGDPERARFLQWFHYLATTLQPDVMIQFHPEIYFPDDIETQERFLKASLSRLGTVMDVIEENLKDGPYFCGRKCTIIDYLFVMQAVWPEVFPGTKEDFPRIKNLITTLFQRSAIKNIHDEHMREAHPPICAGST